MKRRKDGERPAFLTTDNRITLVVPVDYKVGDEPQQVTELQLRRLNAADLIILDQAIPFTEQILTILERMTGHPRVVMQKLDAVDFDRVDDCFGYFREPGSAIGATS